MQRRRAVAGVLALGAGLGQVAPVAFGQAGRKPFRIALLPDFAPSQAPLLKVLVEALAAAGRNEGRDYVFVRSGILYGEDTERAVRLAVDARPDLIFAFNLGYVIAAHRLTNTIPIVMWISGFPVEGGVAASLARPGGNVTGLTIYAGTEVFGKLVQTLLEVRPGIRRVAAFCTYVPPFHPIEEAAPITDAIRDAGRQLGVDLRVAEIAQADQVGPALSTAAADRVEGLVLTSGVSTATRRQEIAQFAVDRRLPTITDSIWRVDPQPLLCYTPPPAGLVRQAADYVDRILWGGARPGDLPIQRPTRFELTVSLKTARAIGLKVPQSILARADSIVD